MNSRHPRGFALVITVVLLALLVLAVFALSALTRVGGGMATAAAYQTQARQHALLGLDVALGELQRHAGADARITGMAGIMGVANSATATTRHWCGVWQADGSFVTWLVSGVDGPGGVTDPIELVATGTVGAASSTSANVEKQHVIAGRIPIPVPNATGAWGSAGRYAWLVSDEGVKLGAYAPPAQRALPGTVPTIGSSMLTNQLKLKTALEAQATGLPGVLSYEQLGLLPSITPSVLQDCFHYVTLTPLTVTGTQYRSGMINLNTASPLVWRSLLDTYNLMPGVTPVAGVTTRGNQIGNNFAGTTVGKAGGGPFTSLDGFAAYLGTIFPDTGSPTSAEIMAALGPMLTIRSDTFRIRALGEAVNPSDISQIEAQAYCEAIVQRTPVELPGFGRRFVIVTFRWLGPDDL